MSINSKEGLKKSIVNHLEKEDYGTVDLSSFDSRSYEDKGANEALSGASQSSFWDKVKAKWWVFKQTMKSML